MIKASVHIYELQLKGKSGMKDIVNSIHEQTEDGSKNLLSGISFGLIRTMRYNNVFNILSTSIIIDIQNKFM